MKSDAFRLLTNRTEITEQVLLQHISGHKSEKANYHRLIKVGKTLRSLDRLEEWTEISRNSGRTT